MQSSAGLADRHVPHPPPSLTRTRPRHAVSLDGLFQMTGGGSGLPGYVS